MQDDALYRFHLQQAGVRGALVQLGHAWQRVRASDDYPAPVATLLGEALAATALFTSPIQFEGRLSLQLRGESGLRLLFADCTHEGILRGIARWDADAAPEELVLVPGSQLAITIENALTDTRYQGLVAVEGDNLAAALAGYFAQSEQLPTRLVLAADEHGAAGLMLQQVATGGGIGEADADGWNRSGHLLATLTPEELLGLPADQLLLRLFHEEGVLMEPALPLAFGCTCSRERVIAMLQGLGQAECEDTLEAEGSVGVTCGFCNRRYRFDAVDIARVFAPGDSEAADPPPTRH